MRICLIGKFPPIQGGVSATNYWASSGLADNGHDVTVVTNAAEVEPEYRAAADPGIGGWDRPLPAGRGRLEVLTTHSSPVTTSYIPTANPYVSKLTALATHAVRVRDCEVVVASYLEPYAVAGALVAAATGVPLVVRHAGSDLDRLLNSRDLSGTYQDILRRADAVLTRDGLVDRFLRLGVPEERLFPEPALGVPHEAFHPRVAPFTRAELALLAGLVPGNQEGGSQSSWATIGMYGKAGVAKGSVDLVQAVGLLRDRGVDVEVLAMVGGRQLHALTSAIDELDLRDRFRLLPFVPPWLVGRFVRTCDAVCFLERDFPVAIHGPRIPGEVLACGTYLILSGEILRKQPWADAMRPESSPVVVDDPRDTESLAAAIASIADDPDAARRMGQEGRALVADAPGVAEYAADFESSLVGVLGSRAKITDLGRLSPRTSNPVAVEQVIRHAVPWLPSLFPEEFPDGCQAWAADLRRCPMDRLQAVHSWCERLAETLDAPDDRRHDVLRYLAALYSGRRTAEVRNVQPPLEETAESAPVFHGEVLKFDLDLPTFLGAAADAVEAASEVTPHEELDLDDVRKALAEARGVPCYVAIAGLPRGDVLQATCGPAMATALRLCSGERTTDEIAHILSHDLAGRVDADEVAIAVRTGLERFHREGALTYQRA